MLAKDKNESKLQTYLASLCAKARDLGATQAVAVPASDVLVDERTELKCQVPLCPHYGRDLMCPPNVMPAARFREVLKRYHGAVLVKLDIPATDLTHGKAREDSRTDYLHTLKASQRQLLEIIGRLEAACVEQGYPYAAGLVAGACPLCDECVGVKSGLPCHFPFRARPSMEAVGIDVMATAKKAGFNLDFGENQTRSWVGLVLVE